MAQTYSTELAPTQLSPAQLPSATSGYGARIHRYRASITLAAQASGDTRTRVLDQHVRTQGRGACAVQYCPIANPQGFVRHYRARPA